MSESPTTSMATPGVVQDATPDVIQAAEPTRVQDAVSHALVPVTEQEVGFGTAAAIPLRPRKFTRRLIDAIRVVGAALHPPTRRHYPQRFSYLEMLSRMLITVTRLRVTLSYAVMLVAVAMTLLILGPHIQDVVIRHMSTNLHNLEHGHLETAVGSAFVAAEGPIWVWLPGLVCLLALAELLWHSGRLIVTFTLGHIGATLIVAVELTAAIQFGWLPVSVAHASDVGISYGAAAVLGALTAAIPPRCRPAWIGWWLAIGLLVVWLGDHFTNTGHFVALTLGMLLSMRFRSVVQWTRVRFALLAVGGAFGYLMLVNIGVSLVAAPLVGTLGALASHWAVRRWRGRQLARSVAVAAEMAPEPVLQTARHPRYLGLTHKPWQLRRWDPGCDTQAWREIGQPLRSRVPVSSIWSASTR
jgi:hypothetical protein